MNRVQTRSCELHLHHRKGKRALSKLVKEGSRWVTHADVSYKKKKKKILESKRRARENEILEEGKKHKPSEVFQKKKKVFRNPASGTTVLNSLGYHSVLCVHTSKHAHLITCAAEIIAISPYLGGGGSLASRNKSLRGK